MAKRSEPKPRKPIPWHRLSRRSDIRLAIMLVVGLVFTANAYLTSMGTSGLTKLTNNPFDFGPIKIFSAPTNTYVPPAPPPS